MYKYIDRLTTSQYLSKKLVLFMDVIVSVIGSGVALGVLCFISPSFYVSSGMAFLWMGSVVVSSFAMFILLKTHRSVIRYSTLRDIGILFFAAIGKIIVLALIIICFLSGLLYIQ